MVQAALQGQPRLAVPAHTSRMLLKRALNCWGGPLRQAHCSSYSACRLNKTAAEQLCECIFEVGLHVDRSALSLLFKCPICCLAGICQYGQGGGGEGLVALGLCTQPVKAACAMHSCASCMCHARL